MLLVFRDVVCCLVLLVSVFSYASLLLVLVGDGV